MAGLSRSVLREQPLISIGIPVYNGDRFIHEALVSILTQSYEHLEVVISDNASTDGTRDICEACASADNRVRYYRQPTNRGAAWNYNFTFQQSKGDYFKWAAHDDLLGQNFISRALSVLSENPLVSLATCTALIMDDTGKICAKDPEPPLDLGHGDPVRRFREAVYGHHYCLFVFGLIPRACLKQTSLIGPYACSDLVLLGQLALLGKIIKLPHPDFLWRSHPQQSMRKVLNDKGIRAYGEWFNPTLANSPQFPHWRLLKELLLTLKKAPIRNVDKVRCLGLVMTNRYRIGGPRELLDDIVSTYRKKTAMNMKNIQNQ